MSKGKPITLTLRRHSADGPYEGGAPQEVTMKPRMVIITIEAESTDKLEDIPPFIKQAIAQSDDGAMIVKQVKVQVVQEPK